MEKPDKDKLEELRFLIVYCKRMSSLIVSNYNDEIFDKERIDIIFNELLKDRKPFKVKGYINIDNDISIKSKSVISLFEIFFSVLENIKDMGVMVVLTETEMRFVFDSKIQGIKDIIRKSENEIVGNIIEKFTEDGTEIKVQLYL